MKRICCNKVNKNVKLVFCINNNKLSGLIKIGKLVSSSIISQTITSSNLVTINITYKNGKNDELTLQLSKNNKKLKSLLKAKFTVRKKTSTDKCLSEQ